MKHFFGISILLIVFANSFTFGQSADFKFSSATQDSIYCALANDSSSALTLSAVYSAGKDTSYNWNFGNDSSSTGTTAKVTYKSGMYSVTLTLKNKNKTVIFIKTRTLYIRPYPNAYFTVADTIISGKNLDYIFRSGKAPDSIAGVNNPKYWYHWTLDSISSGSYYFVNSFLHQSKSTIYPYRDTLTYNFAKEGKYYMKLKVNDYFGCSSSFDSSFYVSKELKIPNAFTPNNDGVNDYFYVQTNGRTVYSLKIFTQTGIVIFSAKTKTIMWDGVTVNGTKAVSGTYYYVIEPVENAEGQTKRVGFLMLFR